MVAGFKIKEIELRSEEGTRFSPNALPPDSTMAWIFSAAAIGFNNSLSSDAGPPPRTSSPAGAPFSKRNTVQPVPASVFSIFPIFKFLNSVIGISNIIGTAFLIRFVSAILFLSYCSHVLYEFHAGAERQHFPLSIDSENQPFPAHALISHFRHNKHTRF